VNDNPSAVRRIAKNAASILLKNAAGDVLTSYAIALAAVSLGASGFGILSSAQAFMDPFLTLCGFGLGVVTVTVAMRRGGCDGTLQGTLAVLHAILASVAVVASLGLAFVTGRSHLAPVMLVLAVNLLVMPVAVPAQLPVQLDQAMHRLIVVPSLSGLVRLGLAYVAVRYQNTPVGHQLAAAAAGLVATFLTYRVSRRYYPSRWTFDRALARELVKTAWPAALLEVVVMIYSRAGYLFLESHGPRVLGEYAAADRLTRPLVALASAVVASAMPSVARLAVSGERSEIWSVYVRVLRRAALVLVPIVVAVELTVPWLLARFVPEYGGAGAPVRVLVLGTMFMTINQLSSMFFIGLGRFRMILGVALFNLVNYFVLAGVLIPRHAALGAAWATTIMEGMNGLVQVLLLTWTIRVTRRPS
jgi:O-antigen/teichoic acid export membrane protein